MVLKPQEVSVRNMAGRVARKDQRPSKKKIVFARQDHNWAAIHDPAVNGVVAHRDGVRAIDTFFKEVSDEAFAPSEFVASLSDLRNKLEQVLPAQTDKQQTQRKFVINDMTRWVRLLMNQARSRFYKVRVCPNLEELSPLPGSMHLLMGYCGFKMTLSQPDGEGTVAFKPYDTALLCGKAYDRQDDYSVAVKMESQTEKAFYVLIEPSGTGRRVTAR